MTKWECYRCSYAFEGDETPEECPNCHYSLTFWLEQAEEKVITIRNFVKTNMLKIDGNLSAWEAARAMRDKGFGNMLVTLVGEPVGIITGWDIVNRIAAEDLPASKVLVRKIMSSPLITVSADSPLADAMKMMSKHHVSTLFVTDQGKPMGLLNIRSIAGDQFPVARAVEPENTK